MKRLTLKEAADQARCSVKALRRAIDAAILPASRPGRSVTVLENDLNMWLKVKRVTPRMDERVRMMGVK